MRRPAPQDNWASAPSEEAYPCSPRGTGAGRCSALKGDKAETGKMQEGWCVARLRSDDPPALRYALNYFLQGGEHARSPVSDR